MISTEKYVITFVEIANEKFDVSKIVSINLPSQYAPYWTFTFMDGSIAITTVKVLIQFHLKPS